MRNFDFFKTISEFFSKVLSIFPDQNSGIFLKEPPKPIDWIEKERRNCSPSLFFSSKSRLYPYHTGNFIDLNFLMVTRNKSPCLANNTRRDTLKMGYQKINPT
jgi:hypothetical protein